MATNWDKGGDGKPAEGKPAHSPEEYANLFKNMPEKDKKMLAEIQAESFWRAAMPLSATFMAVAGVLAKTGKMKPHPRFGFSPKIFIAGISGFFTGKTIYFSTIQQKILDRMPDSEIASVIRNKGKITPRVSDDPSTVVDAPSKVKPFGDMPEFKGLDDTRRPSMDREMKKSESDLPSQRNITYDDLRRQNRGQADREDPPPSGSDVRPPPPPPPPAQEKTVRRNKWGDIIED